MTAPRVHVVTLGCKVNAYDGASIADRLRGAGCELVGSDTPAAKLDGTNAPGTIAARARLDGPDAWRGRRGRARLAVGPTGHVAATAIA